MAVTMSSRNVPPRRHHYDLAAILGANVSRIRDAMGASQEEIAFRADMNRAYLSDVERGKRNPTVRVAGRIADALGVEPSELFRLPGRGR